MKVVGPVVMFGGGGHARSLADVVRRVGGELVAVVAPEVEGFGDVQHIDDDGDGALKALEVGAGALGIGDSRTRLRLVSELEAVGAKLPAVVAGTATVADTASVGPGSVVFEHGHVGPRVSLGAACVVNTNAVLEHDVECADGVFVGPAAVLLGGVRCGRGAQIGAGAVILPYRSVAENAVVGAGSVVTENVDAESVVVGVPARDVALRGNDL